MGLQKIIEGVTGGGVSHTAKKKILLPGLVVKLIGGIIGGIET